MKHLPTSLALLAVMLFASCNANRITPNDNIVTHNIDVDHGFNALDVDAGIKVIFTQSAKTDVVVEAPDNVVNLLDVTIKSGKLKAGFKPNTRINGSCNVTIYASSPSLNSIDLSSCAEIEIPQGLDCSDRIDIDVSSSAALKISSLKAISINLDCSSASQTEINGIDSKLLTIEASSSAAVTVKGRAANIEIEASSASQVEADGLEAHMGKAEASSAASVNCRVGNLNAVEKSSGSVSNRQ